MYQDVAVMAVSQAQNDRDRQDELLEGLIGRAERDSKQTRQLYLLAAACVADAGMVDPKWVKLVQKKTKTLLPPRTSREAQVLATAGEFTLDLLADIGRTRNFTTAEAVATTEAISMMGGGGEVGMRILRTLTERFPDRISWDLITAWHQVQDPQEFFEKVLVYSDFSTTLVQINSADLVPLLERLPGLKLLGLGEHIDEMSPLPSIHTVRTDSLYLAIMPVFPRLRYLEIDSTQAPTLLGVERFPHLETLTLVNNPEPDLRSLTALPRLASLKIFGAKRLNLAPLAAIPTLSRLTLSSVETIDLTPLADLWNLSYLSAEDARIATHKALPHITQLVIDQLNGAVHRAFPRLTSITAHAITNDKDDLATFSRLTKLAVWGRKDVHADPLEAIPYLNHLDLQPAEVVDVEGLANLRISKLTLRGYSASIFGELKNVARLRTLSLESVPGRSLAKLPALPTLKTLSLWGLSEPPLAELRKSPGIAHLRLDLAEDADLHGLTALPSLTELSIGNANSADISPLRALPSLEHLSIYTVRHFDRSVLRDLTGLKTLILDGDTRLTADILPPDAELTLLGLAGLTPADLARLPTLRRLTLRDAPYGLAALAIVPTIGHLTLNSNADVRAEDLTAWPALRSLSLENMPGQNLSSFTALPHLRELELNGVSGDGIAALTDLEVLTLGRTRIGFHRLSDLPKLRHLVLKQRTESDLSILATLPQLKKLELVDMPWADLSPFQARPDIEIIQR